MRAQGLPKHVRSRILERAGSAAPTRIQDPQESSAMRNDLIVSQMIESADIFGDGRAYEKGQEEHDEITSVVISPTHSRAAIFFRAAPPNYLILRSQKQKDTK